MNEQIVKMGTEFLAEYLVQTARTVKAAWEETALSEMARNLAVAEIAKTRLLPLLDKPEEAK